MLIESVDCDENWGEGVSVGNGHDSRRELTVNHAIDRRSLFVPADRPLVDCFRNIDYKMNPQGRRVGQGDGDKRGARARPWTRNARNFCGRRKHPPIFSIGSREVMWPLWPIRDSESPQALGGPP